MDPFPRPRLVRRFSHTLTAAAAATISALLACADVGDSAGTDCARVVQHVQGLPNAVRVTREVEAPDGHVEIDYESFDGENLPVAGSASCNFAVIGAGSLELVSAVIDGEYLDPAEVTAANRALSKNPRE